MNERELREMDATVHAVLGRGAPPGPPVRDDEQHDDTCRVEREHGDRGLLSFVCRCGLDERDEWWDDLPSYTTDDGAAMAVLRLFAAANWGVRLDSGDAGDRAWACSVGRYGCTDRTPGLAFAQAVIEAAERDPLAVVEIGQSTPEV